MVFLVRLAAQTDIPKENPFTSAADMARGARLFTANCAPCHAPKGNGGRGANLARPRLPRAADDAALFQIIRDGIPNTEMPGRAAIDFMRSGKLPTSNLSRRRNSSGFPSTKSVSCFQSSVIRLRSASTSGI